jgi:hypothetical protein
MGTPRARGVQPPGAFGQHIKLAAGIWALNDVAANFTRREICGVDVRVGGLLPQYIRKLAKLPAVTFVS